MSPDPPLPTVPTGEVRSFDLILPETPVIAGPGSGPDPSGSGGTDPVCESTLTDLVNAVNTSPTFENGYALFEFIQTQTGQTMQELLGTTWTNLIATGETQTANLTVCGVNVSITLSGELLESDTCDFFPTMKIVWDEHDFNFPSVVESAPFPGGSVVVYDELPDFSVHIEDPRMTWVEYNGPIPIHGGNYLDNEVVRGGTIYEPTIQVNGSYTGKILRSRSVLTEEAAEEDTTQWTYKLEQPLFMVAIMNRDEEGGTSPTIADAISLGTIVDDLVEDTDYPNRGSLSEGETVFPLPTQSSYSESAQQVYTVQAQHTDQATAWQMFLDAHEAYQDDHDVYGVDLVVDFDAMEYTATFMRRENALHITCVGCRPEGFPFHGMTAVGAGWWYELWTVSHRANSLHGVDDGANGALSRYIREDDFTPRIATTGFNRVVPQESGTYVPEAQAALTDTTTTDGRPPDTTPNPPLTPIGGGCRSSLDGPSSCNWTIPVPAAPQPEAPDFPTVPNFPMPGDNFPDVPVIRTDLPNLPSLPCTIPDFGNMNPCGKRKGGRGRGGGAGSGFNGPLPGGRDRMGNRGSAGTVAGVKTAGPTYGAPRLYTFAETTCPGQETPGIGCMAVITQLLMDAGISPLDIIFQIGPEWDKPFPADKCFAQGSRFWDAAVWTAAFIMCRIIDEGPPTNDVYIGPPWHRPGQTTWTFDEHYDLFGLTRGMSAEEAYGWVEVFGPNVTSPIIIRIDDPFSTVDSPTLMIEVGANYSQADAADWGALRAAEIRREAVSVQVVVPYSSDYFMRDNMVLAAPDRGFQETYVIVGKESDRSAAGHFHILSGMLPATLAELDAFPEVTDEYNAVEGGFVE